jgi:murein peptide amidase A
MTHRRQGAHPWVYWVWGVNGLAVLCLLSAGLFYFNRQNALASNYALAGTPTRGTIQQLPPTSFFLPTLTPNPYYTPPPFETPTPFVLANGPLPGAIGFSVAGRPIDVYSFGSGEREYLIVAGIHGGYEANTVALANEMIRYLNEHPEIIPHDATLHIIRNMNPDGEARANGVDGRVNDRGVDLNRNFPSKNWAEDWNRDGCWIYRPTTGGTHGGSEPETRAVMNFIASHKITALISYHSAALGVFPGGVPWEEDSKRLAATLAFVTKYPYPPLDTGCVYTGTLADWAVEQGVGAAVDMELANHTHTDFDKNLKALRALLSFIP